MEGKVIFNYPLAQAYEDGYFTPIDFNWLFELNTEKGDEEIARRAVTTLDKNIENGYDHLMMARCETVKRAEEVHKIYREMLVSKKRMTTMRNILVNRTLWF
ncbi:MAG: hypothetical protein H6861_00315 [Rhodospirillales bacterium]|nr:hypothetical protein [Rhodospirillales bacterium]